MNPAEKTPIKEVAKVVIALACTYGALWLPVIALATATTKLFYNGEPMLACGVAAGLVLPVLLIGAVTSHRVGTWFVLNWGEPYLRGRQ